MSLTFTTTPGKVSLLNVAGNDTTVVNAAVVSDRYIGEIEPVGKHDRLFDEMHRSGHWGTLDHCFLSFKIECPILVARQILRSSNMHFNELSMRYLESEGVCYIPEVFHTDVKRKDLGGEPVAIENQQLVRNGYKEGANRAWETYQHLLVLGVRKEQARDVLPIGMYTAFWMSGCLSDWYHFLNLRLDAHAQAETRFVAGLISGHIRELFPWSYQLWEKYARGPINEFGTIQTP